MAQYALIGDMLAAGGQYREIRGTPACGTGPVEGAEPAEIGVEVFRGDTVEATNPSFQAAIVGKPCRRIGA